ncbi:hypothetical protein [Nonomuraea sp. SYSU D8015]|nr:hypothetical protein [Nonomuraea sp. SYSU D8015]
MTAAQNTHPERFAGRGTPLPPDLPGPAWIDKPANTAQEVTTVNSTQN